MGGFSTISPPVPEVRLNTGVVVTGDDGTATITFDPRPSKPTILLQPDADGVIATITEWIQDTSGNYVGARIKTYRNTPTPALTKKQVVASITPTTTDVVKDVIYGTGDFITDLPTYTSDAAGWYWVDTANVIHHKHSWEDLPVWQPAVTFVGKTTTTAVSGITTTTTEAVSDITLTDTPAPNTPVFYIIA